MSVCLCPSGHLPGCRWEKWGHPVGNLTGWIPDGWSSAPSRQDELSGGVTHCCLYPLAPCVSVCLLVPSVCVPLYPPASDVMCEVGEIFLFPLSSMFRFLFSSQCYFILACLWFFTVCMLNCMPVTDTAPSQMASGKKKQKTARWIHRPQLNCYFLASN